MIRSYNDGPEIEVVRTFDQLKPHAEAWNNLALKSPQNLPMSSHAWVTSYLEHQLEPGESWLCLLALEDRRLVGILPVVMTRDSVMGMKRLRLRTPHNDHTFGVDFIVEEGYEKKIISRFCRSLDSLCPSKCVLELKRLAESSPSLSMQETKMEHSLTVSEFDSFGCFIKTSGSFEEYRSRLSGHFKRNLRRLGRKMEKTGRIEITCHTNGAQPQKHLQVFMEIEASGWKGRTGGAIASDSAAVAFYTALTRRLSELGWLEWHFLRADGKAIAGHFAIRVNRSLVLFKIGFDEAYASLSPGNILFEKTVEHAFRSDHIDEINCLSNGAWMRNWRMDKRSYHDLYFFPLRPFPVLFSLIPTRARAISSHSQRIKAFSHFFSTLNERSSRLLHRATAEKKTEK